MFKTIEITQLDNLYIFKIVKDGDILMTFIAAALRRCSLILGKINFTVSFSSMPNNNNNNNNINTCILVK